MLADDGPHVPGPQVVPDLHGRPVPAKKNLDGHGFGCPLPHRGGFHALPGLVISLFPQERLQRLFHLLDAPEFFRHPAGPPDHQ